MPQRSPKKKLSNPKALQFHQVGSARPQQFKQSVANQRVIILSTPIKLKDGSVNIEQRAIPLRMNEDQLVMSGGTKNKVISIKRGNEPPPLALPINQLNKKSPTFVKNEVGQVMGKLIPLGKFSNITPNPMGPANMVPTSPVTNMKSLKRDYPETFYKPRASKLAKLLADTKKITDAINENAGMKLNIKPRTKTVQNATSISVTNAKIAIAKKAATKNTTITVSNDRNVKADGPITTLTSAKPKKQVHLVLKSGKNMASIGQTGRNIKLIPIDQWKLGTKLNFLKTMNDSSPQAKILDARTCEMDDDNKNDPPYYDPSKLSCIIKEEDFSLNDLLEKDPVGIIEDVPLAESRMVVDLENVPDLKPEIDEDSKPELTDATVTSDSKNIPPESVGTKSSGMITLTNGAKTVRLKESKPKKTKSIWPIEEELVLPKEEVVSPKSDERTGDATTPEIRPSKPQTRSVTKNAAKETEIKIKTEEDLDLYQHFGVTKSKMTSNESTMMRYIQTLKRKLTRCEKSKARLLEIAEQRHYRGMAYLTNTQRRFVELQLRNSKNMKLFRTKWFTKMEIVVAQRILKAIGPPAYSKLRKLFSLPSRSVVAKITSKT